MNVDDADWEYEEITLNKVSLAFVCFLVMFLHMFSDLMLLFHAWTAFIVAVCVSAASMSQYTSMYVFIKCHISE